MKVDPGVVLEQKIEVLSEAVRRRFTAEYRRRIGKPTGVARSPVRLGLS